MDDTNRVICCHTGKQKEILFCRFSFGKGYPDAADPMSFGIGTEPPHPQTHSIQQQPAQDRDRLLLCWRKKQTETAKLFAPS